MWSPVWPINGALPQGTKASRSFVDDCSSRSPLSEDGANRDAVVRSFTDLYAANKADFPSEAREPGYRDLLTSAYPIHPELFERLYEDWSTLDRFQRTRGVLRLLALTIEGLWSGDSKDLLIMPSSMPIDDNDVKNELVRFLDNQWEPIISQDVDGGQSVPTRLDAEKPQLRPGECLQACCQKPLHGYGPWSQP